MEHSETHFSGSHEFICDRTMGFEPPTELRRSPHVKPSVTRGIEPQPTSVSSQNEKSIDESDATKEVRHMSVIWVRSLLRQNHLNDVSAPPPPVTTNRARELNICCHELLSTSVYLQCRCTCLSVYSYLGGRRYTHIPTDP